MDYQTDSVSRSRDKERTKRAFIDAAIELIREEGFENVGVNSIASRAGASKVLIYRYFGDFDGLLRAVAETLDPIHSENALSILTESGPRMTLPEITREAILQGHRTLKGDDIAKQLMVWELSHQNSITRVFSEARESAGREMTERLWQVASGGDRLPGIDVHALFAVVMAGVYYMTLRSDGFEEYNGVNIRSEEGWRRIADAVADLVALAEKGATRNSDNESDASGLESQE
jgi:AcrR family transcriptional regulator